MISHIFIAFYPFCKGKVINLILVASGGNFRLLGRGGGILCPPRLPFELIELKNSLNSFEKLSCQKVLFVLIKMVFCLSKIQDCLFQKLECNLFFGGVLSIKRKSQSSKKHQVDIEGGGRGYLLENYREMGISCPPSLYSQKQA